MKPLSLPPLPLGLPKRLPQHIAIIMDGNGRWARQRGLPRQAGHQAGTENLRRVIEGCGEFGVSYLTIFAFSTENWNRPQEEVNGLLSIIADVIDRELDNLYKNGVQLRHLGKLEGINPSLQEKIQKAIERTKGNSKLVLNVAFNYGGRDELICAIRRMIREGITAEDVTEESISAHLFTAGIPDPDLLIRTSGEQRTSNFLLWQSMYTELYFSQVCWPDFDKEELRRAIWEYSRRQRRFGGVNSGESPC